MVILSLLQRFCISIKHWILDCAHPFPKRIEVYAGSTGSVERAVLKAVVKSVDIPQLRIVYHHDSDECRPIVWVGDADMGVAGCTAVCRYLGRLWHLYPVHTENALCMDGSLDLLTSFMFPMTSEEFVLKRADAQQYLRKFANELEYRMAEKDSSDAWLEGFSSKCVVDISWYAAFSWALQKYNVDSDLFQTHKYPFFATWMEAMRRDEEGDVTEVDDLKTD